MWSKTEDKLVVLLAADCPYSGPQTAVCFTSRPLFHRTTQGQRQSIPVLYRPGSVFDVLISASIDPPGLIRGQQLVLAALVLQLLYSVVTKLLLIHMVARSISPRCGSQVLRLKLFFFNYSSSHQWHNERDIKLEKITTTVYVAGKG